MQSDVSGGYRHVALEFVKALAARDYVSALAMTSSRYRGATSVEELRAGFETIVPPDWGGVGPIEVAHAMESWPGRQPGDLGWAYVSVGGELYSEAVIVTVAADDGQARVREVAFGRP